jgi:hypothetical protein
MAGKQKYNRNELAPIICSRIAAGETLTAICSDKGMPSHSQFCAWVLEDIAIADEYTRAREARADARSDRIDAYVQRMFHGEIDPQQCRVAIDAEKWQAGKEQPKRYGDKIEHEVGGALTVEIVKFGGDKV